MGSGAGKVILPLVSLAAAPLTGGTSLGGLVGLGGGAGGGLGTAIGLAHAGLGALRGFQRDRAEDAALAAEMQAARTDGLMGEVAVAERRAEAEKRRAFRLAGIANSGRVGGRTKPSLAGAADRDSRAVFSSLASREAGLQSRARNRIAALRRRGRQDSAGRAFRLLDDIRGLGPLFESDS